MCVLVCVCGCGCVGEWEWVRIGGEVGVCNSTPLNYCAVFMQFTSSPTVLCL